MRVPRKIIGIAVAASLIVASGGAVAVSSSDETPPPSGERPSVHQPRSLPAQGPTVVSAAATAPAASSQVVATLAQVGIVDPKLVRETDGFRMYLSRAKASPGAVCLTAENIASSRLTSACQTPETITQGHLWVGVGGTAESADRPDSTGPRNSCPCGERIGCG